jgi:hypothetical protein
MSEQQSSADSAEEKMPVARPVAFRVPRVVNDRLSKTEFRLFDDEDEARRAACDIGADYDGLFLVADRRAAFFAQPRPSTEPQTASELTQEGMMRASDATALLDYLPSFANIKPRTWDDLFDLLREHGGIGFARKWIERLSEIRSILDAKRVLAPAQCQAVSDEWQLIDTAPKDGTIIDLWWVRNDGSDKSYRRPDCRWAEHMGGWVWEGIWNGTTPKNWTATHWMPRPKPPLTRPQCPTPSAPGASVPVQRPPE